MKIKYISIEGFNEIKPLTVKRKFKKQNKLIRFSKRLFYEVKSSAVKTSYIGVEDISINRKVNKKHVKRNNKYFVKSKGKSFSFNQLKMPSFKKPSFKSLTPKKVLLNFAAPAAAVCLLVCTVNYWTGLEYGLSVKYGDQDIANIKNEAIFQKAYELLNKNMAVNGTTVSATPQYALTLLNTNQTDSEDVIYEKILETDENVLTAAGLFVDDEFMGAVENEDDLNNALDKLLVEYRARYDDKTTTVFSNVLKIEDGLYPTDSIVDIDKIIDKASDYLTIELETDIEYVSDVDYETVYKYDDKQYTDYEKVTQKGVTGEKTTVYRTKYVNGEQVDSVLTSEKITKEPVNKIVVAGTKEKPTKGYATGSFAWPVPYTKSITSYYGYRWGTTHTGIDIASSGCYGQSITATDGGTVTWAGWDNSGYGYYVIIDHGNGYQSLYGHCSDIYVSQGQAVGQGDAIAAIGSTGDSTGNHLHFEIRSGSSRLDPMNFF